MAQISWANAVDGDFDDAADWTGGVVPGSADDAILGPDGSSPYTVTVSQYGTVTGVQTAANVTLDIAGGYLSVTSSAANAGVISLNDGGLELGAASVINTGTILVGESDVSGSLNIVGSPETSTSTTLSGGGAIVLSDNNENHFSGYVTNVDNTISGAGVVDATVINDAAGVIDATGSINQLTFDEIAQVDNAGLIESTGAAGLWLGALQVTNSGTIEALGSGVLTLDPGISTNTGVIEAASGATLDVVQVDSVVGGTLDIEAGATLVTGITGKADSGGFVEPGTFTNAGLISIASDSYLGVAGLITNTGTLSINASGQRTRLFVQDTLTIAGGGPVVLSDDSDNEIVTGPDGPDSGSAFTNVDNTIAGAGTVGDAGMRVVNEAAGIIDATGTNNVLELAAAYIQNAGLIEATGAAGMVIEGGTVTNTGTIAAVGAGALAIASGADIDGGLISVTGSLSNAGAISGTGALALDGGSVAFDAGASLTLSDVTQTGAGSSAAFDLPSLTYAGRWTQGAGTVSVSSDDRVYFTGAGDSFSGTLAGAGAVVFAGGSDAFSGATFSAGRMSINGASATLSGTITLTDQLTVSTTQLVIAASGASLVGGGTLELSDLATNSISGAAGGASLTNVDDRIVGAGRLGNGDLTLLNDAAGVISSGDPAALVIDTGANTIGNAGTILAVGAGGLVIESGVDNTGLLAADRGELQVEGSVTGSGAATIADATMSFASGFSQNVTFRGAYGELILADSRAYSGTITGFSKAGADSLDLGDIAFGAATKASFSGTAAGGVLTVTDGTQTASIHLAGDYLGSSFELLTDGHGGTTVFDPPKPASVQSAPRFVQAMAGFAASSPAALALRADPQGAAKPPFVASSHASVE